MTNPLQAFAERVASGEPLFAGWCSLGSTAVVDALARSGFDALVLDMQHGAFEVAGARDAVAVAAAHGTPCFVRTPVRDVASASRLLDLGAVGAIAPMIDSADDARELAAFCKYPPLGSRSWGPAGALALTGMDAADYLRDANTRQLAIAMVETRSALDALDDILAVDGIDGVLVGPSDLSLALNGGTHLDPGGDLVRAALGTVVERCRAHGKLSMIFCPDGEVGRQMAELGFRVCSIGIDGAMLDAEARRRLATALRP